MSTLLELSNYMRAIMDEIIQGGGEITETIESNLNEIEASLQAKTDNYSFMLDRLESEAEFYKARAEEYLKVSKSCEAVKEKLTDRIKEAMIKMDVKEIQGLTAKFVLSNSKPALILNEQKIPNEYKKQIIETVVDKERIQEDLKLGVPVEGAFLEERKSLRKYIARKS